MQTDEIQRRYRDPLMTQAAQEAVNAFESKEVLEAPPFTDDLSKQEMIDHLIDYHDCAGRRVSGHAIQSHGTKATKSELLVFHDRMHTAQDSPNAQITYRTKTYKRDAEGRMVRDERGPVMVYQFNLADYPFPKVRHRHGLPVLSESQQSAVAAVRNNQRASQGVLSVRDRKTLTELVNNDFSALKQEMRAFAADSLAAKVSEVNADWDEREKQIPDFATQATELYRKHEQERQEMSARHQEENRRLREQHEDAFKEITEKADEKGVTLQQTTQKQLTEDGKSYVNRAVYVAQVQGRKDAIAGVERENKTFLDRALMTLEKQRLTAQRQVLLSGVPEEAMPIVESIPEARALMVQAEEERNAKQLSNN